VETKEARSWRRSYPGESDWDSCPPSDSVSVVAVHARTKGCDSRVLVFTVALGRGVAPARIFVSGGVGGVGAGVAAEDERYLAVDHTLVPVIGGLTVWGCCGRGLS